MKSCHIDIPIYRCTPKQFEIQNNKILVRQLQFVKVPEFRMNDELYFKNKALWDFNEIVGWIRLTVAKQSIVGELFWTPLKRLGRGRWKGFRYPGRIFELNVKPGERSELIFKNLRSRIEKLKEEHPFEKRHIDLRVLNFIGPHLDWCKLISSIKKASTLCVEM